MRSTQFKKGTIFMLRRLPFLKRDFLKSVYMLAATSLRDQYRHTFMGSLWGVIQPSLYIIVLSLVFSYIMRMNIPNYPLRLMSGMLPWGFLVNCFTIGSLALVSRESVLKRTVIPKTMFVIADVAAQLYTVTVSFITILLVLSLILTHALHWTLLLLPLAALPLIVTAFSGTMLLAYIGAYVRDMAPLLNVLFQALFWTVPIVYETNYLSDGLRPWIEYNPFYLLIHPIQLTVYEGTVPDATVMGLASAVAIVVTLAALVICAKLRRNVIYYL
jgi:lipopolysaccharide transport system permease protein